MRIGFIGIGKMGWPMAGHLRAAGYTLTVVDSDPVRLRAAEAAGYAIGDIGAVAAGSDVVISCLPNDAVLETIARQVCDCGAAGLRFVETSTVSLAASAAVAERCANAGIAYLRAPLSGNSRMAEEAALTVLASGPRRVYEELLPLFRCFCSNWFYLGEEEQARLMKLVLNSMVAQTAAMLAEAVALGSKGGLDWKQMWEVMASSAVASPLLVAKAPMMAARDFTPTFSVLQLIKDIGLILGAGRQFEVPMPGLEGTLELMRETVEAGFGDEDYGAVIKVLEQHAGLAMRDG